MILQNAIVPTLGIKTATIGNFDGVHLGHKKVLEAAKKSGHPLLVLTFSNHPTTILKKDHPSPLLTTEIHKISLLEHTGVDFLFSIPFTKEFASQTAEEFLTSFHKSVPFETLVLGHDAAFGKDKGGTRAVVQQTAKKLGFHVIYIDEMLIDGNPVSSSRIRHLIHAGRLDEAAVLLGRPYSILGTIQKGLGLGARLGAKTANILVSALQTPPHGVWAVKATLEGNTYPAIANLGTSPTVRTGGEIWLEVHLLEGGGNLVGKEMEVFFYRYLRPEKKFASLDLLQAQIKEDILQVKHIFNEPPQGQV